jgi:hypothetical protein
MTTNYIEVGCNVTNNKGDIIIRNGDLLEELSKKPFGEITHIRIGFWPDMWGPEESYTSRIFALENVYFLKRCKEEMEAIKSQKRY